MRSPRVARLALVCAAALAASAGWRALAASEPRLRHLAVPLWSAPADSRRPAAVLPDGAACVTTELAHLPGRITSLLRAPDGLLWIGLFDQGVYSWDPVTEPAPRPAGEWLGRQRFVNALASDGRSIFAATHEGVAVFGPDGRRGEQAIAAETVDALVAVPPPSRAERTDWILAGTARGLFVLDGSSAAGGVALPITDEGGGAIRVTALAHSGGEVAIGSPRGVYFVPLAAIYQAVATRARWAPLVFGAPPADTNVVTALTALEGGVLAGTDDGGVVFVGLDGEVRALRSADAAANLINPGAATTLGSVAAIGTQGGGLIRVRAAFPTWPERPSDWTLPGVSALAGDGADLLAGGDHGLLIRAACPD